MDGLTNADLYFDKDIYSIKAIKVAISDFQSIAKISYTEKEEYCICTMQSDRLPITTLKNEFSNYVLEMTVKIGNKYVD